MLDAVSNFKQLLFDFPDLSASNAAPICEISQARISQLMTGRLSPSPTESRKLDEFCRFVRDLEAAFSPAPLSWRNTPAIRRLKKGFERGGLYVRVIEETEEKE